VTVLEKEELGSGATIDTTAFITYVIDTDLSDLIDMYGENDAKLIWQSGKKAIDKIEQITRDEKIDCEFMRCPAFIFTTDKKQLKSLDEEKQAAEKLGHRLELKKDDRLGIKNLGYLEIPNQAKFDPFKFLYALALRAEDKGALIFEHSVAAEILEKGGLAVKTAGGTITAKNVIVATYNPFNKPKEVFAKKGMYKSFVLELHVPKNLIPEGIYWDLDNPYNYFRIDKRSDYDRMILGGADHRYELPIKREKNFQALEEYFKSILPGVEYKIIQKWAGPILEPSDGLPLIGEYRKGQFLAAAFGGNGMTYATIAAVMFCDIIEGQKNDWIKLYDPKRPFRAYPLFKKAQDYIEEFLGGAVKNLLK
jgi:glycine/D-amino acid oxidase-like deaminating enzyme